MIGISVIGYGYWGPNVVRNFLALPDVSLRFICDTNPTVVKALSGHFQATNDISVVMKDPGTHAVVIVTPISTHFALASMALKHNKHVFVEKPLTSSAREASALAHLAKKRRRVLMVDHTFLYTPAVQKMQEIVKSGELGKIVSIDSVRTNLGLFQRDSNVLSDLAVHDFSIIDYLTGGKLPQTIQVTGIAHKTVGQESVAYVSAHYPNNLFVHAHVSWHSPIKIRTMILVGTKKMLLYDDMEPSEKIKIFDRAVSVTRNGKAAQQLRIGYRIGSVVSPHLEVQEGLAGATKAFFNAITKGKRPISDSASGGRIVRIIEKATASIRKKGAMIRV